MLRARVIVLPATLLAIASATPLAAQRLEVAARIGYSRPTGTLWSAPVLDERVWGGASVSVGGTVAWWPLTHFGVQGSVDLRLARQYGTYSPCPPGVPCLPNIAGPWDTVGTRLVMPLRLAARQDLGGRFQFGATLGPAVVRFGPAPYTMLSYHLAHRYAVGVACGLSATLAMLSPFSLRLGADEVIVRLNPANPLAQPSTAAVAPLQHEFTVSAAVSVRVL